MHKPAADLDRITTLLSQCLGRIDEQVLRLQELREDAQDFLGDVLEAEAATLQELIDSLISRVVAEDRADVNRTVQQVLSASLADIGMPVVVRQRLEPGLPPAACGTSQLTFALRRALAIGLGQLAPGGEILVVTRREEHGVVFELECRDVGRGGHLNARAATLCEFVSDLAGHCRVETRGRVLLLAIELPQALDADDL